MTKKWQKRGLVGALALIAAMGCNPIMVTSYLFDNSDNKLPPEYALKPQSKREREAVRVVVITASRPGLTEFIGMEQLLAAEFTKELEKLGKENKEKIEILKSQPLARYREDHPEWKSQHPVDIGKNFAADYVIDMELLDMSIFEPGTNRRLMRGRGLISLSAYDLSKPSKEPAYEFEYTPVFPASREVDIGDEPYSKFRQKFVQRMASELAIKFSAHTSKEAVPVD